MTYKEHLNHLLDDAIQKSEKYFDIGVEGQNTSIPLAGSHAEILQKAKEECEAAKNAYYTFLSFLDTNKIRRDDQMP